MGSLTGGGGLSNSSAASSGTGDQANNAAFTGGSINFGSNGVSPWLLLGLAVLAVVVLKK
ncbi:hypothetical protein [Shewanella fidelis]|uniref:GlyGly-CTERM sorting domain-containing protein n=1 Tax=Shewanella fidelis TaxID=173509 RepID=A0AAW8NKR9_9GAMM|nr:hypothetical protein [Shewanella fidelis]MDR8523844.1 hypothetical protein [Shewanella fidelis]MDW4810392.1 hypothetical protein [Shewanella fidelis]